MLSITSCSSLSSHKNRHSQDEIVRLRKVIASLEQDIPVALLEECRGLEQIDERTMDGLARAVEANARNHLECLRRHKALSDVLKQRTREGS